MRRTGKEAPKEHGIAGASVCFPAFVDCWLLVVEERCARVDVLISFLWPGPKATEGRNWDLVKLI